MQLAGASVALALALRPIVAVTIRSTIVIVITHSTWGLAIVVEALAITGTLVAVVVTVARRARGACGLGCEILDGGPSCCLSLLGQASNMQWFHIALCAAVHVMHNN